MKMEYIGAADTLMGAGACGSADDSVYHCSWAVIQIKTTYRWFE